MQVVDHKNIEKRILIDTNLSDQTAGTHAGGHGIPIHLHAENTGCDRACDSRCQCRRNPDHWVFDDIPDLQHGGTDSLRQKTAPFIFLKAHNSKADHLRTAACNCRTACQACQPQGRTNCRTADGERQRDADDNGNQNPHEEGLQLRCPLDGIADCTCRRTDGGCPPHGKQHADADGDRGGHNDIDLCFLGNQLTELCGKDGDNENSQRTACTAQLIRRAADGNQ